MANTENVKLLGFWASPFSKRVEWALKLKGVDYEYIEEDIFNKSSQLLELNPVHKLVPVFVHGERVIAESFVILEYIDETWKQCPLMPQDPHERAMARFWSKFVEEKILSASWKSMCSLGEEKEKAAKLTVDAVEKIEGELKGKRFFGGESIGYLDIAVGWISYWLPIWEEVGSMKILDPLQFPALTSWMRNFLEHPVIKENLPPRDKMIIYFQNRSRELSSRPREHVKLLGFWASPFVRRVEWALKLKGVDYEYIEEDIFNKSSQLIELNPVHKAVPVLVHGERVIAESFVVLEYIDETWKQCPLMPQDPHERAMARFWSKFAEEKMSAPWTATCSVGEEKEKAAKLTVDALEKIEGELKGKRFFGGESIGYSDIALGWMSYWLPIWEEVGSMKIVDPLRFPALTSWMRNFLEHPVIKENLPPRDKMIIYFQNQRQELTSRPRG